MSSGVEGDGEGDLERVIRESVDEGGREGMDVVHRGRWGEDVPCVSEVSEEATGPDRFRERDARIPGSVGGET